MTDDELHEELRELMAAWLVNELPPSYEPRLQKVLTEANRRERSKGRGRAQQRLWGAPTLYDPELDF